MTTPVPAPLAPHWPPTAADVLLDAEQDFGDAARDALQTEVDSAVSYIMRVRSDLNFALDQDDGRPKPGADLFLGTMRQAFRWHTRKSSPDGMIVTVDMGATRVAGWDPDIEMMCGIGRYFGPAVA